MVRAPLCAFGKDRRIYSSEFRVLWKRGRGWGTQSFDKERERDEIIKRRLFKLVLSVAFLAKYGSVRLGHSGFFFD